MTVPYLSADAIELLSNCCTSKETELWQSLGLNWTQPVRHPIGPSSRLGQVYQPVFSDGWAPTITEKDLMGFLSSSETSEHEDDGLPLSRETPVRRDRSDYGRHHPPHFVDSDIDDHLEHHMVAPPHKGMQISSWLSPWFPSIVFFVFIMTLFLFLAFTLSRSSSTSIRYASCTTPTTFTHWLNWKRLSNDGASQWIGTNNLVKWIAR